MINYEPFWTTMKEKNVTTYALINKYRISSRTIHSLRHNRGLNVYTLGRLCKILDCTPNEVVSFDDDEEEF